MTTTKGEDPMTTATRPPFEAWRLGPGDKIRIPGHYPEVVTVTDSAGAGTGHDRIWWEAPGSAGQTVLRRTREVELLATEDPAKRPWVMAGTATPAAAPPFVSDEALEALRDRLASGAPAEPLTPPCPNCPELRCPGCGYCPCDGRRWQDPALINRDLCTHGKTRRTAR